MYKEMYEKNTGKRDSKFLFFLIVIIASGIAFTIWAALQIDSQLRKDVLFQAKLVASAVDIDKVKTLQGSENDISSANYKELKKQLASICSTGKEFHFVYLMGKNADGDIFFFMDNEDPESEDYSHPGQVYTDASGELKDLFDSGKAFVEGPDPDEWGIWISTMVPLREKTNGKIVAVMGMDIDAKDWKWNVASRSAIPMMLAVVIVIVLLMWMNLRQITKKVKENEKRLQTQYSHNQILTEMREFLFACTATSEIGPVVEKTMTKLCAHSSGTLFILSPSRTDMETIARWGGYPDSIEENVISPEDCWGLRRGGAYIVEKAETGVMCPHIKTGKEGTYICLPLTAKSEVLGLLHIRMTDHKKCGTTDIDETLSALTVVLSLAISNIRLREKLSLQSIKDPLTGLFNRRYLEDTYQREAIRAKRLQTSIGVIMADIDHFKKWFLLKMSGLAESVNS